MQDHEFPWVEVVPHDFSDVVGEVTEGELDVKE